MNNQRQGAINQQHGAYGETQAIMYLQTEKFKVLYRNFKTTRYEIDIIARRKSRLYFIEVKYRSTDKQGKGYEYITPKKLTQMKRAAESWVAEHDHQGAYQLAVISIDGGEIQFIDELW